MHLRNPTISFHSHCNGSKTEQQGKSWGAAAASPSAAACEAVYGGKTRKRCVIAALFFLQVFFVGCFWLLQLDSKLTRQNLVVLHADRRKNGGHNEVEEDRVHFIARSTLMPEEINAKFIKTNPDKVHNDYVLHKIGVINESNARADVSKTGSGRRQLFRLCFREGTLNQSKSHQISNEEEGEEVEQLAKTCQCQAEWHGMDCGQPEVIWRTLLARKRTAPFRLKQPMTQSPHRLVYMLSGYFFSLDLLELQIKTVYECVDYFVLNVIHTEIGRSRITAIKRRLKSILRREQYFIYHCRRFSSHESLSGSCSPVKAYSLFKLAILRDKTFVTKTTDIFLYTNDDAILNRKALKFLKYYYDTNSSSPHQQNPLTALQFRLKHVVYGFYWQHPKLTRISGVVSSLGVLDNPAGGNGDPSLLLHKIAITAQIPAIVIGDLNHYGGWFCQYCQQPGEIISALQATQVWAAGRGEDPRFSNATKSRQIDASYMQKLIAQGQHIDDNKIQLVKLRRHSDKYYAPKYAEKCSWKFGNLLTNLFASIEGDDVDYEDAEAYF